MKFKNYIETESGIKDTSTSPGTAGQLLSSTVAGTSWIDQNTISSGTSEVVDIQVKNISSPNGGINLSKGDPVYIYGSVGASARLYVDLADADSTATNNLGDSKMPCVALLDQDLAPNVEGTATVVGKLRNLITSPIDGSVPSENDTVYVKSGGGLTLTKPTGSTNLIQNVGQVGRVSTSSSGNIVVAALLRSNDVPNLPEGRIWIGDGNTIVSDTVYVDEPNNRVGIGTTNPGSKLTVDGTTRLGGDVEVSELLSGDRVLTLTANGGSFAIGDIDGLGDQAFISGNSSNISINVNGSTSLYCGANNRVGIGTTSPSEKLVVRNGTSNTDVKILAYNSALGTEATLKFSTIASETNYEKAAIIARNAAGSFGRSDMHFALDSTADSGNVQFSDTKMTILNGGNVGIGITNPSHTLEVAGTVQIKNGGSGYLYFHNTNNFIYGDQYNSLRAYAGDNFRIVTNSGERMRIQPNGNVGINTTDPKTKLHVASANTSDIPTAGTATGGLFVSNTNKTYGINMGVAGAGWSFIQSQRADGNTTLYNLNLQPLGGNVGIGTTNTTSAKLLVAGDIDVWSSTNTLLRSSHNGSYGSLQTFTNSAYGILALNPGGGNIGIGTDNPSQKLHVTGNARVTGAYYDSSNSAGTSGQVLSSTATGTDWVSAGGTSGFAPMVKFNRSGINSSTYTMIATVNGNNLSSILKMTMTGTSGNVVFACAFDITVNHSQDIHVKSSNGDYTEVTLRITSDGNEDFSIEAKHNGITTTQAEVCIFPLADEIITPTTTDPGYTGVEYEHTATEGWRYGGVDDSVESSNVIVDGNIGIGTDNPDSKLEVASTDSITYAHVRNDSTGATRLKLSNSSDTNSNGFQIINNPSDGQVNLLNYKNTDLGLWTNSQLRVLIDNGGNVGIGTQDPSRKLEVRASSEGSSGGIVLTDFTSGTSMVARLQDSATGGRLYLKTNTDSDGVVLNAGGDSYFNNGNVGIGTDNPSELLHLSSTGPARLLIEADTDNVTETDNAQIILKQDGGAVVGRLGYRTNTNDLELLNEYTSNIYLGTSNSIKATINANGNFGIGTPGPGGKTHILNGIAQSGLIVENSTSSFTSSAIYANNTSTTNGNLLRLRSYGSDRVIVSGQGNVGINTTNPTQGKLQITVPDYTNGCRITGPGGGSLSWSYMSFYAGTSFRGNILPTSTGVNYNSASDYRLKENVTKLQNSTERVKKLKPSNFNFLENPSETLDGFIAHEVQEVVPEAVTGEKDAVGRDGRPKYQGIDQSKIVPLLTAALQEAISKIEQLETRIQTLENK